MHLEDQINVNFRIERHDLTEISEPSGPKATGQEVRGTQVTPVEPKSFAD